MRALRCHRFGAIEDLSFDEVPLPFPGPGEVRLRVAAVGLNFPDALIVQGLYQMKPSFPFSPGSEASGVVDAVGEGVTDLAIGNRVLALTGYGAMAERVVARAERVARLPAAMSFAEAAAFGVAYATSHHALVRRGRLRTGEMLLVLGAGGGVGLAAVELGHLLGARVIAAASTDAKLALARAHGATATINYADEDLREGIARAAGGAGPDVIYDPVGGDLSEPAFRSIAWGGRYLVVGFAGGAIPRLPLNLPLIKGAELNGVLWGGYANRYPAPHQADMRALLDWYGEGRLHPHVSRHFAFDEAIAAIRWLADGRAMGKVVLDVADL